MTYAEERSLRLDFADSLWNFAEAASAYYGALEDVPNLARETVVEVEERLARSARNLLIFGAELDAYRAIGQANDVRVMPRHVEREVSRITSIVAEQVKRWGCSELMTADGDKAIAARLNEHRRRYHVPYLAATLAWRSMPGVEPNALADSIADKAEEMNISPIDLSGTDPAERVAELYGCWKRSPALSDRLPDVAEAELRSLAQACAAVSGAKHSARFAVGNPFVEPDEREPANAEDKTPADLIPLLDAIIQMARSWLSLHLWNGGNGEMPLSVSGVSIIMDNFGALRGTLRNLLSTGQGTAPGVAEAQGLCAEIDGYSLNRPTGLFDGECLKRHLPELVRVRDLLARSLIPGAMADVPANAGTTGKPKLKPVGQPPDTNPFVETDEPEPSNVAVAIQATPREATLTIPDQSTSDDGYISFKDACALTGLRKYEVTRACDREEVRSQGNGKGRRVHAADLARWVSERNKP
jgi:hypothetical protein